MMMTTLRSQMKTILWILVFAFLATIVFSWGMGGFKERVKAGVIGEINKKEIKYEDFEQAARRKQEQTQKKEGKELDQDKLKQLREDLWDEEVERLLKFQEAKRLGLEVSDREIAHIVEFYPPNEIREVESFKRNGRFDINLYHQFLRRPEAAQFLIGFEESVRNYLLEQKLIFHTAQAADVSPEQVKDEFLRMIARGKLRFIAILFDKVDFDTTQIDNATLQRYYQLFPDRYKQYGQRRFAYVKFKLQPSGQDSLETEREAEDILSELQAGADFENLAKQRSEDPASAEKGGDLDWFGRGAMTLPFESAAFKAEIGQVVGPIESKFGYHIIWVEDKKIENGEEKVKARHILLKIKPSADTREAVYNQAYTFAQDIEQHGFEQMVQEYGYAVDTTKAFSEAGYIAGLGRMRMAAEFCFNNPVRTVSDVYPIPEGYVVFKIVEAIDERIKPFSEVSEQIRKSLTRVMRQHKASAEAARLRARMSAPPDLDAVAGAAGLPVYSTEDTAKSDGKLPEGLKADKDFLVQAFRLNSGELSDVIEGKNGCYIAVMEAKSDFSEDDFRANYSVIYMNLTGKEQQNIQQNWIRELRIAGNIQDYRYRYFRDF
ncbi:MAG: hypothetical protein FJY65_11290 [Calditrichaeota bacterium]|nr:hypothetical protein [Calditrichota bacterium]